MEVSVIGAGLAGCEAAYALADGGVRVKLYEQKPDRHSPAHHSDLLAELVCSNSLKAMRISTAAGLLKAEGEKLGSLVIESAYKSSIPAGGALAVDRNRFSAYITEKILTHPNITLIRGEVTQIPSTGEVIIATGPLTSDRLTEKIQEICPGRLSFYDAAAPIIEASSIDTSKAFFASRYERGGDDYLNCPLSKEEYERFHAELINAERAKLHEFEDIKVYEGCMPVEIMARRGEDTLRFGPLKPVGLYDPRTGKRPWAVVQLRAENSEKTMYNIVGFQTNLKFSEQQRVFSMIPGLENAVFVRFGVMHRNTFIDSPRLLDEHRRLKSDTRIRFAGQITGVEGYIESALSGLLAGIGLLMKIRGEEEPVLPHECMLGALNAYLRDTDSKDFQPMGASMGLLPGLSTRIKLKEKRYEALSQRALSALDDAVRIMHIPVRKGERT